MATYYSPKIVTDGLVFCLDAGNTKSYPARCFVSAKIYSVYNGGVRSANYTVQYSDDNTNWTTAFSGVARNNESGSATCGINNNTGSGSASYGRRRYWRYVEGSAIVSHHPRVSRIILVDDANIEYNLIVYVSDNCSDSGTYIVGTVSVDVGSTTWTDLSGSAANGTLANGPTFNSSNGGNIVFNSAVNTGITTTFAPIYTNFTVEVWFKDNASPSYGRLVDKSYTGGFWLGRNGSASNSWGGGILESVGPFGIFLSLTDGIWHCLVSIRSGTTHTLYGDGITNTVSNTVSATALDSTPIAIGNWYNLANGQQFNGNIAAVKMYNRALSAAEVLQNYNATKGRFGL